MNYISVSFLLIIVSLTMAHGQDESVKLNAFLDSWHEAAANADASTFFDSMAENAIYIGTDATERWTKEEFFKFAKPYFDRGKAWAFTPYDRQLHFSKDGQTVWFSELLNTWMGICRGSGVIEKINGSWQIQQYHLSITVPNDLVQEFIELVENFEKH